MFPTEQKTFSFKILNVSNNEATIDYKISDKEKIKEYFNNYNLTQYINGNILNTNLIYKQNIFKVLSPRRKTLLPNETLDIKVSVNVPLLKNKVKLFSLLEMYHNGYKCKSISLKAEVEVPKFTCFKTVSNESFSSNNGFAPLFPVKIEITSKGQKYRIPFKNFSIKEMVLNFMLIKKDVIIC
jgi:hypothetical protein